MGAGNPTAHLPIAEWLRKETLSEGSGGMSIPMALTHAMLLEPRYEVMWSLDVMPHSDVSTLLED